MQVESTPSMMGSRWVRPSTPEDAPAIVALMRDVGLQPHVETEQLYWKYWRERPDWPGPRSFVLTDGRMLLAHGAVVPGTLRTARTRASVIHMIDWAARRDAVGAGVMLMKHVGRLADYLLGIGGSEDTLSIMPRIGYHQCGAVQGFVRTLSPLGILRRPSGSPWKRVPRIARSVLWTLAAPRGDLQGWSVRRVRADGVDQIGISCIEPRPGQAIFVRSPELLRHALDCPIVPVELYVLERAGRIGGYFLLSYAPGQARLADCWMASEEPADWCALAHAAVGQARCRDGMAELIAWSSDPLLAEALADCGFHERLTLPIYLRASGCELIPEQALRVQMLDNDAYYLYIGGNELWA